MNTHNINDPEIQDIVRKLRNVKGYDTGLVSEFQLLSMKYLRLKEKCAIMEKKLSKRDCMYERERDRVLALLRVLTLVKGSDLKKAVCLAVYWDFFSWMPCDIVERLREDKKVKAFFDLPRNYGNIKSMKKCVNTKEFADALRVIGYGAGSEFRSKNRHEWANAKKSEAIAKMAATKAKKKEAK